LTPARAPRSFRGHGNMITSQVGAASCSSPSWMIVAGAAAVRWEPSADSPAVTVIRIRARSGYPASASTAPTPARIFSRSGSGSPRPAAETLSRTRCRVSANGTPPVTLSASNTPSPVVRP
jgi:hypothetical protein